MSVYREKEGLDAYHKFFQAGIEKHGNIFRDGEKFFTANPRDWEIIFQSLSKFDIGDRQGIWATRYYNTKRNLPLSYVDTEGEEFYNRREWMGKNLLQPNKVGKVVPKYSVVADELLTILEDKLKESINGVIENVSQYIVRWQFECGGILTFDKRLGVLSVDPDFVSEKAAHDLFVGSKKFFHYFQSIEFGSPIHKTTMTKTWKEYETLNDRLFMAAEELLQKYGLKTIEGFEDDVPYDVQKVIVADLMRASAETVSVALMWMVIELGRNPEAQQLIYEEVSTTLSKDPVITEKVLQKQHYTKAFIKEVFRVRPLLAYFPKMIRENLQLDSGYEIPCLLYTSPSPRDS